MNFSKTKVSSFALFIFFPKILNFFFGLKTMNKQKCSDILLHGNTNNFLLFNSIMISPVSYFVANIFLSHKYFQFFSKLSKYFPDTVPDKSFHTIEFPIIHLLPKYDNVTFNFSRNPSDQCQLNLRRCY